MAYDNIGVGTYSFLGHHIQLQANIMFLVCRPAVLPTLQQSDDTLRLSDGEDGREEGEDAMDTQTDDMTLPHHPAPIAVCYLVNEPTYSII